MSSSHSCSAHANARFWAAATVLVAFSAATLTPATADAQTRSGFQTITAGLMSTPGLVHDKTSRPRRVNKNAAVLGMGLKLALQHAINDHLFMGAELGAAEVWLDETTAHPSGFLDSGGHFALQAGLVGRWVPRGYDGGPALGLGLHTFRVWLPDAPLQSLAPDLRLGWYFWRANRFVFAEVAYAPPLLQGLDLPTDFTGDGAPPAEQDWKLHRFFVSFDVAF